MWRRDLRGVQKEETTVRRYSQEVSQGVESELVRLFRDREGTETSLADEAAAAVRGESDNPFGTGRGDHVKRAVPQKVEVSGVMVNIGCSIEGLWSDPPNTPGSAVRAARAAPQRPRPRRVPTMAAVLVGMYPTGSSSKVQACKMMAFAGAVTTAVCKRTTGSPTA